MQKQEKGISLRMPEIVPTLLLLQAMVRYLAARGGLVGANAAEAVFIDMVAEAIKDARGIIVGYAWYPEKKETFLSDDLPAAVSKYFPRFEALLDKAAAEAAASGAHLSPGETPVGQAGYLLVSGKLSYADVLLAELVEEYEGMSPGLTTNPDRPFPRLAALRARVTAIPALCEYLVSPNRFPFPEGAVAETYVANVKTVLGRK